jgi:hypothetical protein
LWLEASLSLFISARIQLQLEIIMITIQKLPRSAVLLVAGVVTALTLATVANAVQTITTANAATFSYSLANGVAGGTFSAPFTPVFGRPVLVMGVNTTIFNRGVGQVTLLRSGIAPTFLEWAGIESPSAGPAALTDGFSGVPLTHIVFIDFNHLCDIEVATPDSLRVHNNNPGVGTFSSGNVTLIW